MESDAHVTFLLSGKKDNSHQGSNQAKKWMKQNSGALVRQKIHSFEGDVLGIIAIMEKHLNLL